MIPKCSLSISVCLAGMLCASPDCVSGVEQPVFAQDFSTGDQALTKWRSEHLPKFQVVDGTLVGTNDGGSYGIGVSSPKFAQKDLRASFRFKLVDAKGVQFKLNYVGGGHIGRFIIQPNGFFFQANKNRPLAITEAKNFETQKVRVDANVWHEFVIEKRGDEITGTLNGKVAKSYQYQHLDYEIGTFEVAITGKTAAFDDIVITPLGDAKPKAVSKKKPTNKAPSASRPKKPMAKRQQKSASTATDTVTRIVSHTWRKNLDSFLAANCLDCHSESFQEANLDLETLSTDLDDAEAMRRWVLVFDRVQKGEMPPADYDRPETAATEKFLSSLGKTLSQSHATQREVVLRRLNRNEYENTINDLFGIDIRLAEMLPEDATKHGFDNNGEALALSSELIEVYLEAASLALDRAIGPPTAPKRIAISKTMPELVHENMYNRWFKLLDTPEGTVIYSSTFGAGSQLTLFKIPTEGTYRFRFHAKTYQTDEPVMMQVQTGIITRSGDKRFMGYFPVAPEGTVVEFTDYMFPKESAYPRPFGTINNISGFLAKGKRKIEDYDGAGLLISKVEIEGPLEPWPPASRHELLGDVDLQTGKAADARLVLTKFLPKAFRRPVQQSEVERYTDQVARLIESGRSFEDALRWSLRAALCSPEFLFIEEPARDEASNEIDDFALANRLSYFLWSSKPDAELTTLAAEGALRDPSVLREQAERMLQSDKSHALTKNFAHQWFDLRDIDATSPDTKLYPEFDEYLKSSMVEETERFFEEVLKNNESVASFVDSDWAILNERLAKHYGIEGVAGDEFRRVTLPAGSVRGGVMTQASILKVTANGANTSPVTRGVWMLEKVMGIHPPPPPPPPNVPAVVPDVTGANTLRQLLDAHRAEESCNGCHRLVDPPGFALEEFDAVGAWRQKYQFQGSRRLLPVDSSGFTPSGEPFKGVRDYKKLVLGEIDQITHGLTDKLMTYATGRGMGFSDRPELKAIVARNKETDYGFRDLIHEVIQSPLFRMP